MQSISLTEHQQALLDTQGQLDIYFNKVFTQKDYDEGQAGVTTMPDGDLICWNKGGIKVGQRIVKSIQPYAKQSVEKTPKEKLREVFIKYINDNSEKFDSFTELFTRLSDKQKNDVVDGIIDALTNAATELAMLTMSKTLNKQG